MPEFENHRGRESKVQTGEREVGSGEQGVAGGSHSGISIPSLHSPMALATVGHSAHHPHTPQEIRSSSSW